MYTTWESDYADDLMQRFQLVPSARLKELSSGEGSKLRLLLALAHRPSLVILDEPTSGLDPLAREQIMQTLREYLALQDSSILFSTHIPADLEGFADQLLAIRQGQVAYIGDMDLLTEQFFSVRGSSSELSRIGHRLIGVRATTMNFDAIIRSDDTGGLPQTVLIEEARVDEIVKALAVPLDIKVVS